MIARGGAMAAMGYLPVELADDAQILPPVNHECQPINFLVSWQRQSVRVTAT